MGEGTGERLRLGHIVYSNCFPVHARLLDVGAPEWIDIVQGVPSQLNALLERGEIDVAPCSSIEFARNADRYRVLPDLVIGVAGAGAQHRLRVHAAAGGAGRRAGGRCRRRPPPPWCC